MNRTPTTSATRAPSLFDRLAGEIEVEERKLSGAQRELARLQSGVDAAQGALAEARELQELAVAMDDSREAVNYSLSVEQREVKLSLAKAALADSPSNGDKLRATARLAALRGQVQTEERKRALADAARTEAQRVAAMPLTTRAFAGLAQLVGAQAA